jgi:hypothetical protein
LLLLIDANCVVNGDLIPTTGQRSRVFLIVYLLKSERLRRLCVDIAPLSQGVCAVATTAMSKKVDFFADGWIKLLNFKFKSPSLFECTFSVHFRGIK